MLEKKALRDQEAASTREADISMEMDRQKAVLAAQVLNSPFGCHLWFPGRDVPDQSAPSHTSATHHKNHQNALMSEGSFMGGQGSKRVGLT